jgi:hypothetical protein
VTLLEFSRRTGWPYRELLAVPVAPFLDVLEALGLALRLSTLGEQPDIVEPWWGQ